MVRLIPQDIANQIIGMATAGATQRYSSKVLGPSALESWGVKRLLSPRVTARSPAGPGWTVLPWLSKSPDLNPIEHIWHELERRLQARQNRPNNVAELRQALVEEWNAIPRERVRRVICSMRRRCQAVVAAAGGHNRYWFIFLYHFCKMKWN